MNKKQIEMLRFIVKQEIEAAGIDGLYDHGAAAWTERMLDENWKDFQETFTDPDELEYRSFDSIEELFEDLHADEKIYLRRLFQKEEKEKEKISEEENEGRLKACLEQIRKLTHADLDAAKPEKSNYLANTDNSLVNRVALAISRSASDEPSTEADEKEIFHWKPEASAAVSAVAEWLNEENNGIPSWTYLQLQKEIEAQ